MKSARVTPVRRPPGILHCPQCGAKLGSKGSPAVGYFTCCSLCGVALVMRIDRSTILVTVKN